MSQVVLRFAASGFLALSLGRATSAAETYKDLDPQRIEAIATMLPETATGMGRPSTVRDVWNDPAFRVPFGNVVRDAEKLLTQEFPPWDDELYLDFSRTGQRPPGEAMLGRRHGWLYPLVMAECLENKGRFLAKINFVLNEYAGEKAWTLPAHDRGLGNFKGTDCSVDLASSAFAAELAQALYLLGSKLDDGARQRTLAAMEARVFGPVRASLRTGKGSYWLTAKHNWNSVCLAGVTGAALSAIPDRKERAVFVAAALHYGRYYLEGYQDDGYCEEGTGYWNYGFANFINLRELLLRATDGKVDLFSNGKIRNVALYGLRIQLLDRLAPPYSDCRFGTRPDDWLVRYSNITLGLGVRGYDPPLPVRKGHLLNACMDAFPFATATSPSLAEKGENGLGPRSYFNRVGVLVCRPAATSDCRLAASIKAGGNGNHSHNDIGSFVVQLGKEQLVGDPGGPRAYTSRTFGPERYTMLLFNSLGHPVPVVAGKLQREAPKVHPRVLRTEFTDDEDVMSIDLATAYEVPELRKLVRTFRYNRTGAGSVIVEDEFEFTSPQAFEISLLTAGKWARPSDRVYEFSSGKEKLRAGVLTPEGFEEVVEKVPDSAPESTRIGLKLRNPLASGTVRVAFVPVGP